METTKPPVPPKQSPEEALRSLPPQPSVRRLRGRAILMLLGAFALIITGRMVERLFSRHARLETEDRMASVKTRPADEMLERSPMGMLPSDYSFIPPPRPPAEVPAEPKQVEPEVPVPEPDPEMIRRLEEMRQELKEAMDSPIAFSGFRSGRGPASSGRSGSTSANRYDPGALPSAEHLRQADSRARDFFADSANIETSVRSSLQRPQSPYEIKAGTIIPAALVTGINSDLPGDLIGQVTSNVFDSVTGRYLLIPQGSRLLGRYNSEVKHGHDRVLIAWQRLLLPNGDSIVLDAMPGTDAAGVSGLSDRVDFHVDRLIGATVLSTMIALGSNFAANINPDREELVITANTVAEQAARSAQQIIDRELSVQPTVLVRPGTPFHVLVNRDLPLRPYMHVSNRR